MSLRIHTYILISVLMLPLPIFNLLEKRVCSIHQSLHYTPHSQGNEFNSSILFERTLFVFSINGLKQNARSLLTPVSDSDFFALPRGSHLVSMAITGYFCDWQ